jgi:two-component system chemotaxis response regulator CheY
MDITMPEMDGLESLKAILALQPAAQVVMISAMGQESMVREAVLSGARGFIVKPFKEDVLVSALSALP